MKHLITPTLDYRPGLAQPVPFFYPIHDRNRIIRGDPMTEEIELLVPIKGDRYGLAR